MDSLLQSDSVRILYIDPGAIKPSSIVDSTPTTEGDLSSEGATNLDSKGVAGSVPSGGNEFRSEVPDPQPPVGPLTEHAERAARARQVLQSGAMLRPLRLTRIGVPLKKTAEDQAWLKHAMANDVTTAWKRPCTQSRDTASRNIYLQYMFAKTMRFTPYDSSTDSNGLRFPESATSSTAPLLKSTGRALGDGHARLMCLRD